MNSPHLIVNADDFGLSHGITDAVVAAHRDGILTSASLMVNQPASKYAVACLSQMPGVGIGIHLNLTQGGPVLPPREVPTLVDTHGAFHRPEILFRKLWCFRISGKEIEAEFRAQIQWMKAHGVTPLHADSHLHVHIYPGAVDPFGRALAQEGIRYMRAPRCTAWPHPKMLGGPHRGRLPRRLVVQSYRTALQLLFSRDFAMPQSRIAFAIAANGEEPSLASAWVAALNALPSGVFELACHPGFRDRYFSSCDRIATQREREQCALVSPELRQTIETRGIQLIRYDEMLNRASAPQQAAELHAT